MNSPSGKAPSDVFVVKKGRGAPKFSTRKIQAATTGGSTSVYNYSDGGSGYSTQANKATGAANLYAPSGAFAAQVTGAAVSGGYAMTLAQANGNTYTCSMPDPNNVPTGTSTYNGVTFNIDPNAGPSSASYRGMTVTTTYDSSSDTITANLPDGGVAKFPNVTYSASSGTASASGAARHTEQVAQALLCVVRIIIAIIVTIMTILVIYATIAICLAVSWTILGIIGCVLAIVVAIVFVIWTIFSWIYVWIACTAIPPPPPAGAVPAQQAKPVPVAAAAA